MTDWRHQLAELERTEPDRDAIRRRLDEGSRFPDPIETRREPQIAVISVAAVIAIAGMAFLFVAFRNQPELAARAPVATGPAASTTTSAAPPCPISDRPTLGEAGVRFNTDCLVIVAQRPTTITEKAGGGRGLKHALIVCSDKDCNKASQIAGTDVKTGPALLVLNLPGLEPGTYFFEDPVHPVTANGTLYVVHES